MRASRRWVVVEKPAGMLSVPGKGPAKADCLAARIRAAFPGASGPLVVHRLDMETSGLMVFGLDEGAQRELSRQFEARRVEKRYVALLGEVGAGRSGGGVDGEEGIKASRHRGIEVPLLHDEGVISLPMRLDVENRPVQIVDLVHGREAVTRWRVLGREIDRARVEFEPLTGRTHQLRVHAAAGLGRPIVGDVLYGGEPADRLMLHASYLSFLAPETGARVEFRSPAPF